MTFLLWRVEMYKKKLIAVFVLLGAYLNCHQPFQAEIKVANKSAIVSAPNLVDLDRDLKQTALPLLLHKYTPVSPLSLDINLRGIYLLTSFAAGSTTLVVNIPQSDTTLSFTGGTRDQSLELLRDYIRNGGTHHKLLKAYARYSPIDPIAGNPNSLMALMGQADYLIGHLSPFSGCNPCWSAQPIVHQYQTGAYYERAFSHQYDTTTFTLPLRYSYSPDRNWALIIDAPFTYIRNGGASSLVGSLGVGLRYPVNHNWSLTPTVRYGSGGTLDMCTSGSFLLTGLNSVYNLKVGDFVFSLTDYAGYSTSINLWLTGVNFNYHLHNWIFKNGLSVTSCADFILFKRPLHFSAFFIDSCFSRDHLYIKHYDEIGCSIFTSHILPCLNYDCMIIELAYQFGQKNYRGYKFNLAYQF